MISRKKRERLEELDALLRSEGVDIEKVAARWDVLPGRVKEHMKYLHLKRGMIEASQEFGGSTSKRIYRYADASRSLQQSSAANSIAQRVEAASQTTDSVSNIVDSTSDFPE